MRFKGTFLFALVIAALVAFAIYDYRRDQEADKKTAETKKIFQMKDGDVVRIVIEILSGSSRRVVLEKADGLWRIVEPLAVSADQSEVETFLDVLLAEDGEDLQVDPATDLKDFGLSAPAGEITLATQNRSVTVQISSIQTFDKRFWVRIKDQPRVLLSGVVWEQHVAKDLGKLRDKTIFVDSEKGSELTLFEQGRVAYTLRKDGEAWSMVRPAGLAGRRLRGEQVSSLMNELSFAKAQSFAADSPSPRQLRDWGLDRPVLSVQYRVGESLRTFDISAVQNGEHKVREKNGTTVFNLSAHSVRALYKPVDELLDFSDSLAFDSKAVTGIQIEGDVKLRLQRVGAEWRVETAPEGRSVVVEKLDQLLGGLKELRIVGSQAPNLTRVERAIRLIGEDAKAVASFEFGPAETRKNLLGGERRVRVLRTGGKRWVVDDESFSALPREEVVEIKGST
jgi:hypothetical protein